jgi:hypothetical protein
MQAWHSSFNAVRKEKVTLTDWSHIHLLHGEPAPVCINCGVPLTLAHILVDCPCCGEAQHVYNLHSTLTFQGTAATVFPVFWFLKAVRHATLI